jgi:Lipopolysaccharide export system permease LptF/LptG
MTILDRYIVRSILGSVLLVLTVVLILGALFVFIDQQDDIGVGHYTAVEALWYTLLNLPQQAFELLPITVLIGSLVGLGSLAQHLSRECYSSASRCCSASFWRRRCRSPRASRRRSPNLPTSASGALAAPGCVMGT